MASFLCNLRYSVSLLSSNAPSTTLRNALYSYDMRHGGVSRIVGTVTELGVPGAYRVRLYDRRTALLARESWSDSSGNYAFNFIAYRDKGYFAVAHDNDGNPLNAAIADLITPEPMP
jgi:hypothetical protein